MNNIMLLKPSKCFLPWILSILSIVSSTNCTLHSEQNCNHPEVTISQGKLLGEIMKTRHDREIYSFLGIPYAEPPVGILRFEEPVPAKNWTNTLFAVTEPQICPQLSDGEFKGNEDCLYLNVYTPKLPISKKSALLPVMVYIHGGGFERGNGGSALYGPRFILDEDVVLVTLNYRIGPLGFLSTGDEVVPGNNGLKDQVMALKWVKHNIENFCGDSRRVTIFGQSTGGCSVHLLALSNLTTGLFHQYIVQSGSAFSIRAYRPRSVYRDRAFELGRYLGCPDNSSRLLINCLKELNAKEIIETKSLFYIWKNFPDIVWGSTDEPESEGAFLTQSPQNIYADGKIRDLPSIIGDVRSGGLLLSGDFYANPDKFEALLADFDDVLPFVLQYDQYVNNVKARTDALKAYYFNNDLTGDRSMLLSNFTDLLSDSFFIYPIYNAVKQQLSLSTSRQYFYLFEYRGSFSNSYRFTKGSTDNFGAVHNDELLYLFPETRELFGEPERNMTDDDFKVVDTMVRLWTSFAIHGTPTASIMNETTTWKPFSSLGNNLQIGKDSDVTLNIQYSFFPQRMQFWENLTTGDRIE